MNRQKYNNAISHKMKSKLIKLVHPKLANIWYIWQQLIPQHHITPSILH